MKWNGFPNSVFKKAYVFLNESSSGQLDAFVYAKREFSCLAPVFSRGLQMLLKDAFLLYFIFSQLFSGRKFR